MVPFTHARRSGSLVLVALLGGCATAGGLAARRAAVDAPSAASPGRRAVARVELPTCAPARGAHAPVCLLYTSPSPRDRTRSRMPSSA